MIDDGCWQGSYPIVMFKIYKNDLNTLVKTLYYYDAFHRPYQVYESAYSAGDKFIMTVQYEWTVGNSEYPAKDYTVKIYSK